MEVNLGSPVSGSRRPRGRRPAVPRGAHRPTHRLVVDRDAARAVAEQAARSLRPFRAARTARRRERALAVRPAHRNAKLSPAHRHPRPAPRTRARRRRARHPRRGPRRWPSPTASSRSGGDPLSEERRAEGVPTFVEAAERVLEQKRGGWRGRWHAQNCWRSMDRYIFPRMVAGPSPRSTRPTCWRS